MTHNTSQKRTVTLVKRVLRTVELLLNLAFLHGQNSEHLSILTWVIGRYLQIRTVQTWGQLQTLYRRSVGTAALTNQEI